MDRILTTHVGSLQRSAELTDALLELERGAIPGREPLRARIAEEVDEVVAKQAEIGVDVIDDGEMGKTSWITYIYGRVSGIEPQIVDATPIEMPDEVNQDGDGPSRGLFGDYRPITSDGGEHSDTERKTGLQWVCNGPIEYTGLDDVDLDIANLKSALQGVDVVDSFIPCVAPASVYWFRNDYYKTEEEFVYALADALKIEYRRIHEAGIMVHVDDAVLWHIFGTMRLRGQTREDYNKWAQLRIDALNHALEGIPADRVRYHICSGSHHSAHSQDPLLLDVIDMVLQVNAKYLLIEQSNARHEHEWRIWEDVELPEDKVLVPGVVTHQTQMVEHPELVAQRLVRLAKLVGRERVMAGTDCGFAQTANTRRVPLFTQWAKLQSMVEGAQIASRELWPAKQPA